LFACDYVIFYSIYVNYSTLLACFIPKSIQALFSWLCCSTFCMYTMFGGIWDWCFWKCFWNEYL